MLETVRIQHVEHTGQHRLDTGLRLRADVHRLFDREYLGVDEHRRLRVSPRIRTDHGNGAESYSSRTPSSKSCPSGGSTD